MPLFRSSREKRFWLYALTVWAAILASLSFGRPLQEFLQSQQIQAAFFLAGLLLVALTIFWEGWRSRSGKKDIVIGLGAAAVGIMLFFRLGASERSHLMEFSVLAIFIYKALSERFGDKYGPYLISLLAFIATTVLGVFDESLQLLIPTRVFDPQDMLFNCIAAFIAIGGNLALQWARKKIKSPTN